MLFKVNAGTRKKRFITSLHALRLQSEDFFPSKRDVLEVLKPHRVEAGNPSVVFW